MSFHNIPCLDSSAMSLILISLALEEIALSHIVNEEGFKLQGVVKAFNSGQLSVCEMLSIDENIAGVLKMTTKEDMILLLKLIEALEGVGKVSHPHFPPYYNCK